MLWHGITIHSVQAWIRRQLHCRREICPAVQLLDEQRQTVWQGTTPATVGEKIALTVSQSADERSLPFVWIPAGEFLDDELSPSQQKQLETLLNCKVIDRSRLILDIFAQHARTHEGRLQVDLAQLEYQLPRLTRMWMHLSRTGSGIGTRAPGESQLEKDRRIIRDRIKKMKSRVEEVRQQRAVAARSRDRRLVPTVGIVGYTNAGKSTLLNALVGSEVALAEDKLFATLDPTSRMVKLGDGQDYRDRVHKLPLPLAKEGAYLVVARGADLHTSGLVLVTPLAVEVQTDPGSGQARAMVKDTVADRYLSGQLNSRNRSSVTPDPSSAPLSTSRGL